MTGTAMRARVSWSQAAYFRSAEVLVGAVGAALGWRPGRIDPDSPFFSIWLWVKNRYPKWVALINGNMD